MLFRSWILDEISSFAELDENYKLININDKLFSLVKSKNESFNNFKIENLIIGSFGQISLK